MRLHILHLPAIWDPLLPLSGRMPWSSAPASVLAYLPFRWHVYILLLIVCIAIISIPPLRTLSHQPDDSSRTRSFPSHPSPTCLRFSLPVYTTYHLCMARLVIRHLDTSSHPSSSSSKLYYVGAFGRWWSWPASSYRDRASITLSSNSSSQESVVDTIRDAHASLDQYKSQASQKKAQLRAQIRQLQETHRLHASRCQELEHKKASMKMRLGQLHAAQATRDALSLPTQLQAWEACAEERTQTYLENRSHLLQRISSARTRTTEFQQRITTLQARLDALRPQIHMHSHYSTSSPVLPPLEPDTTSLCHLLPSNLLSSDDTFDTPSMESDSPTSPLTPSGSAVLSEEPCIPSLNPRAKEFTSSCAARPQPFTEMLVPRLPLQPLMG